MRIVALAGGVGAARFLSGLVQVVRPEDLTIIVNTADDFRWMGLHVSPDIDTVTYTLAGLAHSSRGWGIEGDSFLCLDRLGQLGGAAWFAVGDRDLATHLFRTGEMSRGERLSAITSRVAAALGVRSRILPMTDDPVPTEVQTTEGSLPFQDYFVRRQCVPQVTGIRFADIDNARPAPGVIDALETAEAVIICPSNPLISIGPILSVPEIRPALGRLTARRVAVTPLVEGRAVKGPTAKMMREMGLDASARGVARLYRDVIDAFILDSRDAVEQDSIAEMGLRVLTLDTVMASPAARARLAQEVMDALA
jgi:LPPG:FO 2-phospho-L-lactate transferase